MDSPISWSRETVTLYYRGTWNHLLFDLRWWWPYNYMESPISWSQVTVMLYYRGTWNHLLVDLRWRWPYITAVHGITYQLISGDGDPILPRYMESPISWSRVTVILYYRGTWNHLLVDLRWWWPYITWNQLPVDLRWRWPYITAVHGITYQLISGDGDPILPRYMESPISWSRVVYYMEYPVVTFYVHHLMASGGIVDGISKSRYSESTFRWQPEMLASSLLGTWLNITNAVHLYARPIWFIEEGNKTDTSDT
jgi:hypothetical protein